MEETIVIEWLKSLFMGHYAGSFIDNGYDDLEICKQINEPDLDAIGVIDAQHRSKILHAVQVLKVEGAASVYFTLEEAQAAAQESVSHCSDPGPCRDEKKSSHGSAASTPGDVSNFMLSGISSGDIDAYEAGRAELVRLPQLQLRELMKEKLSTDKINLTIYPYTTKDGEAGNLEGLASRYADEFNTHYQDVLEHLEFLRVQEWTKVAMVLKVKAHSTTGLNNVYKQEEYNAESRSPRSSSSSSLDHNDDYPIYLPGKYNPSSCLSDAEEDQIYGFTGPQPKSVVSTSEPGYLNPRSQCIYELPPLRSKGSSYNGMKKRLGFGRLLKTLRRDLKRSSDLKHKNYFCQTMSAAVSKPLEGPDLSSTPLVVLPGYSSPTSSHHSHSSRSQSSGQSCIITSISAPGTPGSQGMVRDSGLQHDIERLKEQQISKRRQDQCRDQEQILQDLHNGLRRSSKQSRLRGVPGTYAPFPICGESTYMYADDSPPVDMSSHPSLCHGHVQIAKVSGGGGCHRGKSHFQHCDSFPNGNHQREEDVISLKTAGDITLPRDSISSDWQSPRHIYASPIHQGVPGLYPNEEIDTAFSQCLKTYLPMDGSSRLSQSSSTRSSSRYQQNHGQLASLDSIALGGLNDRRDSPIDVQSITSRLSSMSADTNRSESQQPLFSRRTHRSSASDGARSETPSDFDEEEERMNSVSLVGRMKCLQRDMQKKISQLKRREVITFGHKDDHRRGGNAQSSSDKRRANTRQAGSYYQRQNSLPVKLKQFIDPNHSPIPVQPGIDAALVIGHARALVDYHPSPYDKEALMFKKGEIIDILSKNPSGLWKGHLNGVIGFFKFILVEEICDEVRNPRRYGVSQGLLSPSLPANGSNSYGVTWSHTNPWAVSKVLSLPDLLSKFNLGHLIQVLALNGFEDLDQFRMMTIEDLDRVGIVDTESRGKLLAAIGFLVDSDEYHAAKGYGGSNAHFLEHPFAEQPNYASQKNGRLPTSCIPSLQGGIPYDILLPADQIYQNTAPFAILGENDLDIRRRHNRNGLSYSGKPTFNIPLTEHVEESSLSNLSSPSFAADISEGQFSLNGKKAVGQLSNKSYSVASPSASTHTSQTVSSLSSPHSESVNALSPSLVDRGSEAGGKKVDCNSQRDSYHAEVAVVDPSLCASPTPDLVDSLESTTC